VLDYERTFVVSAGPERVWRAFTDPGELAHWHGTAEVFEPFAGGRVAFADPGHERVEGTVEEAIPNRLLRWRTADDTVIAEVFEPKGGGTRVTVTQTSGRPLTDDERDATRLGWDESIADLILLVERGVGFSRHMTLRSTIGAMTTNTPAGVEIVDVFLHARRVGLRKGSPAFAPGSRQGAPSCSPVAPFRALRKR
jgi:uncharacterized protein YndB with AHSA1/START domain